MLATNGRVGREGGETVGKRTDGSDYAGVGGVDIWSREVVAALDGGGLGGGVGLDKVDLLEEPKLGF